MDRGANKAKREGAFQKLQSERVAKGLEEDQERDEEERQERKQIRQDEREEREEIRQEEREDLKREREKARGQEESSLEDPERARLDAGDTLRLYSLVDSDTKRRG